MFRFFEYIVFLVIGYKIIRMLFADNNAKQKVQPPEQKQTIYNNHQQQNNTAPNQKFNDAEFIDYEEVK